MTVGATWIRFVHSQEQIKEILDYCAEEKKAERERVLNIVMNRVANTKRFDALEIYRFSTVIEEIRSDLK
jgi:hypothetical protein